MWTPGPTAKKVFKRPGAFAMAVIRQFRANQGVLLAGAVAYYTLLSLVPLLILILMALSHIISEERLLVTLSEYLEFVVPGQSGALVDEVRTFLAHKEVVGGILFVIPRSRHNPKILRIDDAEIVGDRITEVRPIP